MLVSNKNSVKINNIVLFRPFPKKLVRPKYRNNIYREYKLTDDLHMYVNAVADSSTIIDNKTTFNLNISFESFYRVILTYDNWNNDKNVAMVLMNAINVIRYNQSIHIVKNARKYGKAIVVTVNKETAELYVQRMRKIGLDGSMELA